MEQERATATGPQEAAERWLTPDEKEQAWRILKGLCPHNQGWIFDGYGHNSAFYRCAMCNEMEDY